MTISDKQLMLIRDAVDSVGCVSSSDSVRLAKKALSFIDGEIESRRTRGLTISEAIKSGSRFRRRAWPTGWSSAAVVRSDYDGMVYLSARGHYIDGLSEDDLAADDFVLVSDGSGETGE